MIWNFGGLFAFLGLVGLLRGAWCGLEGIGAWCTVGREREGESEVR